MSAMQDTQSSQGSHGDKSMMDLSLSAESYQWSRAANARREALENDEAIRAAEIAFLKTKARISKTSKERKINDIGQQIEFVRQRKEKAFINATTKMKFCAQAAEAIESNSKCLTITRKMNIDPLLLSELDMYKGLLGKISSRNRLKHSNSPENRESCLKD